MDKNVFDDDRVFVCPHCGSTNVGTEFIFFRYYNEPYAAPSLGEAIHQNSDWCYECDEPIIVTEKKGN